MSGWSGLVAEVPRQHCPVFQNTSIGHLDFVESMDQSLRDLGLNNRSSVLFIAHLARETGWGKAIWNNNVGNIKASAPLRGPWFWMTDARKFTDRYRAYEMLKDGLFDSMALIQHSSLYTKSWLLLQAGDSNWYGQLGLDGYYEGPPDPNHPGKHTRHTFSTVAPVQNEYDKVLERVKQYKRAGVDGSEGTK